MKVGSYSICRAAERRAETVEAEVIEGRHFRSVEARRRTVADAIDRYCREELPKRRGRKTRGAKCWTISFGRNAMRHISWNVLKCALVSVGLGSSLPSLSGCASTNGTAPISAESPAKPRITILYDAFGKNALMTKDWGFAALIEVNGTRILFDTGDNPDIFAQNVKAAGVDLTRLDFVVISHRHGDHIGGLTHLLKVNPKVRIYAPKESFGVFGSSLPSSFYRKTDGLPPEMRYFDGNPPTVMNFGSAWPRANFELIDKTTEVAAGLTLIALVSDAPGTKELTELSLAINTPEGIVLVVGCSHPGIEAFVSEAAKINPHIHLIVGGLHLVVAPDPVIEKIATALKGKWKVDWVAPGHCTGEPAFVALKQAFRDRYLYAGLGTVLELGATPHVLTARAGQAATLIVDETDEQTYQALLAQSDDRNDRGGVSDSVRVALSAR